MIDMASLKAIAAIALTLMIAAPIGLGYLFASEDTTSTDWVSENKVNLSNEILNSTYPIFLTSDSVANNTTLTNGVMDYAQVSTTPTSYPMMTVTSVSISFAANTWVDLSAYSYWEIVGYGYVQYYTNGDDSTPYVTTYGTENWKITGNGGSLKFVSAHTYTVNSYTDDGNFADISAGWKLPLVNNAYGWTNYQENKNIRLLIDIPANSGVGITCQSYFSISRDSDGNITVKENAINPPYLEKRSMDLGNYQYVLFERTSEGWYFSGVTSWPGFGSSYQVFNTLFFDSTYVTPTLTVSGLSLRTTDVDAIFRVESTDIVSGSFPATNDFTLNMDNLFPNKSYTLKFNSIGIYGSSLDVGSESYTVTNGHITVGSSTVSLKGATVSSKYNGTGYDVYINNHKIGTEADPASIYFGGDWSLTVTGDILKQVTTTQAQWAPGQFAFDKEDFAACGLLAAGACLIGLGMYGARSGIKMGLLLLICGGAALIYLTFV